jgi:hypothetical protein
VSLDISQAASVADMTAAGRSIPSRGGKFSIYHHVQTVSGVYTDGCFRCVLSLDTNSHEFGAAVLRPNNTS